MRTMLLNLLLTLLLCSTTEATSLVVEIEITGLNLQYDGTSIFDAGVHNTVSNGSPAESTPLTSMTFYHHGNQLGVQTTNVFADIYIPNVLNLPATGGVVNAGGGGFIDLLTQDLIPGWGLSLETNRVQIFYDGSKVAISVDGLIHNSSLPFGVSYDVIEPITVVLQSDHLTNLTSQGGFFTGFNSSGTGAISRYEPEPSSIVLAAIGIVCLAAVRRRRWNL